MIMGLIVVLVIAVILYLHTMDDDYEWTIVKRVNEDVIGGDVKLKTFTGKVDKQKVLNECIDDKTCRGVVIGDETDSGGFSIKSHTH